MSNTHTGSSAPSLSAPVSLDQVMQEELQEIGQLPHRQPQGQDTFRLQGEWAFARPWLLMRLREECNRRRTPGKNNGLGKLSEALEKMGDTDASTDDPNLEDLLRQAVADTGNPDCRTYADSLSLDDLFSSLSVFLAQPSIWDKPSQQTKTWEEEWNRQLAPLLYKLMDHESKGWQGAPHPALSGIALSGGGIRSATLALGVLQRLHEVGIWSKSDYLSTVSGGGYIGSALSSWFADGQSRDFPFTHTPGATENAAFQHLRNYSRYLAPGGFKDKMRLPALFVRGLLLGGTMVFSIFLALAWLGITIPPLIEAIMPGHQTGDYPIFRYLPTTLFFLPFYFLAIFGFQLHSSLWLPGITLKPLEKREKFGRIQAMVFVCLVVAPLLLDLQNILLTLMKNLTTEGWNKLWPMVISLVPTVPSLLRQLFPCKDQKNQNSHLTMALLAFSLPLALWILSVWSARQLMDQFPDLMGHVFCFLPLLFCHLLDANATSLHPFYRDRLSRAYLIKKDGNSVAHNDGQKLCTLGQGSPYHLINASVNLSHSANPSQALRGRQGDFFLFYKGYTGSPSLGFLPTKEMLKGEFLLETAVAISGAAVDPRMGQETMSLAALPLTLFNLRLGFWIPNLFKGTPPIVRWIPYPFATFRDLSGSFDHDDAYLNLTDGGHVENLGIYPLLQRQCRFIVAVDGEQDAGWDPEEGRKTLQLGGLAKLVRLARTDLGIKIAFDADLYAALLESACPYAIASIEYSDTRRGLLVYIKSSFVEKLANPYVRNYQAKHPAFPNESTGDQFFDEEQFEAYRALGYESARVAFPDGR